MPETPPQPFAYQSLTVQSERPGFSVAFGGPPPRAHTVLYYGVLSAHHAMRSAVVPRADEHARLGVPASALRASAVLWGRAIPAFSHFISLKRPRLERGHASHERGPSPVSTTKLPLRRYGAPRPNASFANAPVC